MQIFSNIDLDKLSETQKSIVEAMKEDRMERCYEAMCSTLYYNHLSAGPGPSTKVSSVYIITRMTWMQWCLN